MIPTEHRRLIEVLRDARTLLCLPDNDFVWSKWADVESATAELDAHIALIEKGRLPDRDNVSILFAPTGSIQEVSLSSGWGEQFLAVARKFDTVAAAAWG